jgi:hypothetical protein
MWTVIRWVFLTVLLVPALAFAQMPGPTLSDERFRSLNAERIQTEYLAQKTDFELQKAMYGRGLTSEREFRQAEAKFKTAQIAYQLAMLSLVFELPHITIDQAVKYQAKDGKKRVRLTLRNTTGGVMEGQPDALVDVEGIRTDRITSVYVSLLNDTNSIISQPYEAKIAVMPYDQPITVDFLLLQDLDNVVVRTVYGNKADEKKISLQKDESANTVLMTSEQFSQEADLGTRATYDLTCELFSSTDNVYKLEVLNLPRQITAEFLDAQTNARLSQVKFSQEVNTRRLVLAVYLPDRADSASFRIDHPIRFFAAAVPRTAVEGLDPTAPYTAKALEEQNISFARLELVPRGVGRIQVQATNFYHELKPDEAVESRLTVVNDGTRRLDNVKVRVDVPLNWLSTVVPDVIPALLPGKGEDVMITLTPPPDVNVGDYEAMIKTEAVANNRRVDSEDKRLRLHVAAPSGLGGTLALVALLMGILVGVVVFGIRLSRR